MSRFDTSGTSKNDKSSRVLVDHGLRKFDIKIGLLCLQPEIWLFVYILCQKSCRPKMEKMAFLGNAIFDVKYKQTSISQAVNKVNKFECHIFLAHDQLKHWRIYPFLRCPKYQIDLSFTKFIIIILWPEIFFWSHPFRAKWQEKSFRPDFNFEEGIMGIVDFL